MHDLDRTQSEFEPEEGFESGDFEFGTEELGTQMESPFSEEEEMELASQLLEITDEAELEQFLGSLFKRIGRGMRSIIRSPIGRALGGILKGVAKKALPIAGEALGSMVAPGIGTAIGSKLGFAAGSMFGLELEGLSQEDQEFEVARRYVRFAGSAAQKAAVASPTIPPDIAAKNAVIESAKLHAPGLLRKTTDACGSPACQKRYGRWQRRGNKIVLYGAY